MKLFQVICKAGLYISLILFFLPSVLVLSGYGGEGLAQGGWVYMMITAPFILVFALLLIANGSVIKNQARKRILKEKI
jgi:uncharacterized protein (DUF983 family)